MAEEEQKSDPYKIIDFAPEELQFVYDQFGADSESVLSKMTMDIINKMPEFQGTADINEVRYGTASILDKIYDQLPESERGKALTDDQILRYFTTLKTLGEDGVPTEVDAYLRGLTKGTTSLTSGVLTAKAFATVAPPYIPMFGPLGVLSKPIAGFLGFVGGSVAGDIFVGEPMAEKMFGSIEGLSLTPEAEARFRAYESSGNITPFITMPWLLPRAKLNTLSNIKKLPVANQTTVLTADDFANPMITKYLQGKISGQPTRSQFIALRDKIFKEAADKGEKISLKKAAKLAAQQLNRQNALTRGTLKGVDYLENALVTGGQTIRAGTKKEQLAFLSTEATAPFLGYYGVLEMSKEYPRSEGVRVATETAASIAPSLFLLRLFPKVYDGITNFIKDKRESRILTGQRDLFGTKSRAKKLAIDDIYEVFDRNKEDPDAFLKQLEELMVQPIMKDKEVVGYKLRQDFLEKVVGKTADEVGGYEKLALMARGEGPLFTSGFIESDSIMQLEQNILARSQKGSALELSRDRSFQKSIELQRGMALALRGTGDPTLLKLAGEVVQNRFEGLFQKRMERAVKKATDAVQKIYPEGGAEASQRLGDLVNTAVSNQQRLFRNLEKNAWNRVNRNENVETFFRKGEDGELTEADLPSFVEEWDALLAGMSEIKIKSLRRVAEFRDINDEVLRIKRNLGFVAEDLFSERPPEVDAFQNAYSKTQGLVVQNEFDNYIARFEITNEPSSENIQALGQIEDRLKTGDLAGGQELRNLFKLKRESLIARLERMTTSQGEGVITDDPITTGQLIDIYSVARQLHRTEATVNDNNARIANNVASAVLDDLNLRPGGNSAYQEARNISYAYQNFLKRTFAGDILQTNARGQEVVNDRLLTDKLFSGKPDTVALRLDQIRTVGQKINEFQPQFGVGLTSSTNVTPEMVGESIHTTNEVLAKALRLAIRDIERPLETRTLSDPEKIANAQNEALQQFREKHSYIFEAFPEVDKMIKQAGDASNFLKMARASVTRFETNAKQQKAFQVLTKAENPEKAFDVIFNSDNPVQQFNFLMEVLKAGTNPRKLRQYLRSKGEATASVTMKDINDAKLGARKSLVGFAFTKGGKGDQFNPSVVYDTLFFRLPGALEDSTTFANLMVKNNIMSSQEVNSLKTGLKRIIESEAKKKAGEAVLAGEAPALLDFYTRILGAKLGTQVGSVLGGRTTGAGLIEAEAGSKYLRKLTQELPAMQEFDALEEILTTPELLALALKRPRNPQEKNAILDRILEKLKTTLIGLPTPIVQRTIPLTAMEMGEPAIEVPEAELREEETIDTSAVVPEPRVSPVQTPNPLLISQNLPQARPQPATASGPVDRTKYAALFPNDMASSMIKSGIGGLMG